MRRSRRRSTGERLTAWMQPRRASRPRAHAARSGDASASYGSWPAKPSTSRRADSRPNARSVRVATAGISTSSPSAVAVEASMSERPVGAAGERGQRPQDDADVVPERPARHVDVVEAQHLLEADVAPAEHLPEAGDSRAEGEALPAPVGDARVLVERQGPRADEAHVALEDVDELRQLVERQPPERSSDAGDARIVPGLEQAG